MAPRPRARRPRSRHARCPPAYPRGSRRDVAARGITGAVDPSTAIEASDLASGRAPSATDGARDARVFRRALPARPHAAALTRHSLIAGARRCARAPSPRQGRMTNAVPGLALAVRPEPVAGRHALHQHVRRTLRGVPRRSRASTQRTRAGARRRRLRPRGPHSRARKRFATRRTLPRRSERERLALERERALVHPRRAEPGERVPLPKPGARARVSVRRSRRPWAPGY